MKRAKLLLTRVPLSLLVAAAAFSACPARADYSAAVLADAPALYYHLADNPAFAIATNSGTGGSALNGGYQWVVGYRVPGAIAGDPNNAAQFGAGRVEVPYSATLNPNGQFSIECWAIVTNTTLGTAYRSPVTSRDSGGSAGNAGYIIYANNANRWSFWTGSGGGWTNMDGPTLTYNAWVHLVGTRDAAGTNRLYVNGALALERYAPNFVPNPRNPLRIAAGATEALQGDFYFPGSVDEVAFYPTALTPTQVAAHYSSGTNASRPVPYRDLVLADGAVGYWRLDEAAPSASAVNSGTAGAAATGAYFGSPVTLLPGQNSAVMGGDASMGFAGYGLNAATAYGARMESPYNAAANPPTFSVEAWASVVGPYRDVQAIVASREVVSSVAKGFALYARTNSPTTNTVRFELWTGRLAGGNIAASYVPHPVNTTNHVVGTYDGTYQFLYVNGELVGAFKPLLAYVPNPAAPFRVGAGANEGLRGDNYLRGGVDEAAVYGKVLSPSQVLAHYVAGFDTPPPVVTPPTMAWQPASLTNQIGSAITIDAVAYGGLPLQYQWYKDDAPLAGKTSYILNIPSATEADSGAYYLAVTNAAGFVLSATNYLQILPAGPPVLTIDLPTNVTVYVGGNPRLEVKVTGSGPFGYQWTSNGVPVPTVNGSTFVLNNVQPGLSGSQFQVVVTNAYGSASSATATVTVATLNPASHASVLLAANPVSYWRLGEDPTVTSTALDSWGGNNGVYVNSVRWTPGALGLDDDGAMFLTGTGTYMTVPNSTIYSFTGTNAFTLTAWVRPEVLTGVQRVFSTRSFKGGNAPGGYGFGFNGTTQLRFTAFGVVDVNVTAPVLAGQWQHLAAVRVNNSVILYHNGVPVGTNTAVLVIVPSDLPLRFGGNPDLTGGEEFLNGQIDEAAVFTRALSSQEILGLYDSRNGAKPNFSELPRSVSVYSGGKARLSAVAAGTPPLTYLWRSNNVALAGQTNSTILISNVTSTASYSITVANAAGSTSAVATVSATVPAGYASSVISDGPVAYWKLNDPPSGYVHDMWGGNEGITVGGVSYQTTPGALFNDPDTAMSFDGQPATKAVVPWAAELNPPTFTALAWAKVTGGAGRYRAVISSRDLNQGYIIYAGSNNRWQFWTRATGFGWATLTGPAIVENEWTHLAISFDGTTRKFFVDGMLVGSDNSTVYEQNLARPFRIGAGNNEGGATEDYNFQGDIDEVAIYSKPLSEDQILFQYAYGKYSTVTGPIIVQEPVPAQSLVAGSPAGFSVRATGSPTLVYQWFKDGSTPIVGATRSSLTLNNAWFTESGSYHVRVSNGVGVTNSQPSSLYVGATPLFANLTNKLVLHLRFDGNYADASGRNNEGLPGGTPTFVAGRLGQAVRVSTDTTNFTYNYVSISDNQNDLSFDTPDSFSVSFWTRYTGTPDDLPMLGNAIGSTYQRGWAISDNTGRLVWTAAGATIGSVAADPVGPVINDDAWHNVVLVIDRSASLAFTYIDGVLVDTRSIAGVDSLISGSLITVGQDPTGGYQVNGAYAMDDLGIWRRALSGYEAASIFAAARSSNQSFDVYGPVRLDAVRNGADLEFIWQAGTLLQSDTPNGTYTPVAGAAAPYYKVTPGAASKFYRIQL